MPFKNPHIIVTGAAIRVGRAITETLLNEGCRISAHHFRSQGEYQHPNLHFIQGDLLDPLFPEKLIKQATAQFGDIDGIVLSASLYHTTDWKRQPFRNGIFLIGFISHRIYN